MTKFAMQDTPARADGVTVDFHRLLTFDASDFDASDFDDDDETAAKINAGELVAYGVQAEAAIRVTANGVTTSYTLSSAGLWGLTVASSTDPYLNDVYGEELDALRADMRAMGFAPTVLGITP